MATKPWSDVASSDAFKQLSPTDQAAARRQYFDTVVAPQVPDNDRQAAWQQFDSDTASRAQALPAGIRPSQAGGGRGSINPPADAPFRVDVTGTAADEQPAARSNGLAPLPPEGAPGASAQASSFGMSAGGDQGAPAQPGPSLSDLFSDGAAAGKQALGTIAENAKDFAASPVGFFASRVQQALADRSVLDKTTPAAPRQQFTPVSAETRSAFAQQFGAMPAQRRRALETDPALQPWQRSLARETNAQLDAAEKGAEELGTASPTLEGRTQQNIKAGMRGDLARNVAATSLAQGGGKLDSASAPTDGLDAADVNAAHAEGRTLDDDSIADRATYKAGQIAKQSWYGALAAGARAMGDETTAKQYEIEGQKAQARASAADELLNMRRAAQEQGIVRGGPATYLQQQAEGAVTSTELNAPSIAAAILTGGASGSMQLGARVGLGLMGGQVFGQEYITGRSQGLSPAQSAGRAGAMGALEILGERYGMLPQALNALRGKAAKMPLAEVPAFVDRAVVEMHKRGLLSNTGAAFVRGQAGEQIGEQLTNAGQYLVDGTPLGLDQPMSIADFLASARDTAVQTAIQTGIMQGAGHVAGGLARRGQLANTTETGQGAQETAMPPAPTAAQRVEPTLEMKSPEPEATPAARSPAAPAGGGDVGERVASRLGIEDNGSGDVPLIAGKPVGDYADNQLERWAQSDSIASERVRAAAAAELEHRRAVTDAWKVNMQAHEAATSPANESPEPTDAQKAAGNYKLGHVKVAGLDISVENPEGSTRRGTDADGQPWESTMTAHYGYIRGAEGADGDKLDVFLAPGVTSDYRGPVFVVDQVDPRTGAFDEHKAIIGAKDEADAESIYRSNYAAGWNGSAAVTRLPMGAFRAWAKSRETHEPLGDISRWRPATKESNADADLRDGRVRADGAGGAETAATLRAGDARGVAPAQELDARGQAAAAGPVAAGGEGLAGAGRAAEPVGAVAGLDASNTEDAARAAQAAAPAVAATGEETAPMAGDAARGTDLPAAGSSGVEAGGLTDQGRSRATPAGAVVLQNRDRSTAASIAQMNAIAARPDYLRTGPSRTMDQGAPVVFGDIPQGAALGREETVADGRGDRVQTRYAVVDAADVLTSNNSDGTSNADYAAGRAGALRAVAGNGRAAGIAEAYRRGTAGQYRADLQADLPTLGIDAGATRGMRAPVLVRVMDESDVTPDIGDRSNTAATARLSPVEEAANDAKRVDLGALKFEDSGEPSAESVRGFVHAMPEAERGNMLNPDGSPTRQAVDRLMAATFKQAYGNDELVRLYAQATDPEARSVMNALAGAAGPMAQLAGVDEFDIRGIVAQAAEMAVNASRRGLKLADMVRNADMDMDRDAFAVAEFFAQNIRSAKRMGEGLRNFAQQALEQVDIAVQNAQEMGMFGDQPTLTRADLLRTLKESQEDAQDKSAPATPELAGGREPAEIVAQRQEPSAQGTEGGAGDRQGRSRARGKGEGRKVAKPLKPERTSKAVPEPPAQPAGVSVSGLTSYTADDLRRQDERNQAEEKREAKAKADDEARAKVDAERGEFTLTGSERAADVGAAGGQQSIFERGASYNQPYETDLFGNPISAPGGRVAASKSRRAGVRGNISTAGRVPVDTEPPEGDYNVRTIVGRETTRKLGAPRVNSFTDLAQATQYLYRSAVERLDAVVTDAQGIPLGIVGGFKGAIAQSSVYPSTLIAEAVRIPRAARIWFSHNHPSGQSELSPADKKLNAVLADAFRGSGIEPMGLIAVGDKTYSATDGTIGDVLAPSAGPSVPVIEREQVRDDIHRETIGSPAEALAAARQYYEQAKRPGMLLLDTQHRVVAWVPITDSMMGRLRGTGQLNAIYRAISESNANAVILVHKGELDAAHPDASYVSIGQNIAAAAARAEVRPLDIINVANGDSVANRGGEIAAGPLFSRVAEADLARYEAEVDDLLAGRTTHAATLGRPSAELRAAGIPDKPLRITKKVLEKISGGKHDLTTDQVKALPKTVNAPVLVFRSATEEGSSVAVLDAFTTGRDGGPAPIVVAIKHDGTIENLPANVITSAYGKDEFGAAINNWVERGLLIAAQKKTAAGWLTTRGLQLPKVIQAIRRSGTVNISENAPAVKALQDQEVNPRMSQRGGDVGSTLSGEKDVREALVHALPNLAPAIDTMLARGKAGKRGGLVVIDSSDERELAIAYAERTGRSVQRALAEMGVGSYAGAGDIQGFYDPQSGLTFLVAPNLTAQTAPPVLLHEATHAQQRENIDRLAKKLIDDKAKLWRPTREFLGRVQLRMAIAGESDNLQEAATYIVEQAAMEGRQAGFSVVDGKFMDWLEQHAGKRVASIVRDFVAMVRTWALRHGVPIKSVSVDDLTAYARWSIKATSTGRTANGPGTAESRRDPTTTPEFKRWFGKSQVVDDQGRPKVMYHGTGADIASFRAQQAGAIFLTDEPIFAHAYADQSAKWMQEHGKDGAANIMPVYARAENPFDYVDEGQVDTVLDRVFAGGAKKVFLKDPMTGHTSGYDRASLRDDILTSPENWSVIESPEIQAAIHAEGYDGFYVQEAGFRNLAVYSSMQVKSATGNNGSFDPESADLRFSRRNDAPADLPEAVIGNTLGAATHLPEYAAAKAGDPAAAMAVAKALVTDAMAGKVRALIGQRKPVIVPVVSVEAAGHNQIPLAVAQALGAKMGLDSTEDIVQANAPKRTSMDGLDRIFNPPVFDGPVKAGQDYLLLDDTLTQGGTFAALASHIRAAGGNVVGAVALTGKQYSAGLRLTPETLNRLREKYGDVETDFRAATGYGFGALTESEGRYLANFKPAESIRDRIAASRSEAQRQADAGDAGQGVGGIRFSRSPGNWSIFRKPGAAASAASAAVPEETKAQTVQRKLQDSFNRVKVLQNWASKNGILLNRDSDVYGAEERYYGRAATRIEDFRERTIRPIIEAVQKAGFTMAQVDEYLHAQHAQERNAQIAKIDSKMQAGSGMTDADAQKVIAAADPKLVALANKLQAVTDSTRDILVKSGIVSRDVANAWQAAYKHYVPLKGGDEESAAKTGTGPGMSVNGSQKRALGHGAREEHIVENIMRDHERAIQLAEKNRVGLSLLSFVADLDRPDIATIDQPVQHRMLKNMSVYVVRDASGADLGVYDSLSDANRFIGKAQMPGLTVHKAPGTPELVAQARPMLEDNEAAVYVNGYRVRVQLNDPLLANAYKRLGIERLSTIMEINRGINRFLSAAYTGYNPAFLAKNIIRDWTTGMINMAGEQGATIAARAALHYPKAFAALLHYAVTGKATQEIKAYRDAGGTTGAAYLSDIERIGADVQASYEQYQGAIAALKGGHGLRAARVAAKKLIGGLAGWIEHLNMAGENAMRLAIFQGMRDAGKTVEQAASAAKNSTVNFNRKGEWTPALGSFYLFFNPAVQGAAASLHAMFRGEHKYQAQALAGMMGIAAYLLAQAQFGGGDDDEKEWRKISAYTKQHNIIIRAGSGYVTIPIPYDYGYFWQLGNAFFDLQHGGDPAKVAVGLAVGLLDSFSPINPFDEAGDVKIGEVVPGAVGGELLRDAVRLYENQSSLGGTIVPDSRFDQNKPDSQRMWRTTKGTVYDKAASTLNAATGGTESQSGAIDISPETLKFWTNAVTGGTGTFIMQVLGLGSLGARAAANPGEAAGLAPEASEIPILRDFYKQPDVKNARQAYWAAVGEARKAADDLSRATKAKDAEGVRKVIADEGAFLLSPSVPALTTLHDQEVAARDALLADPRIPEDNRVALADVYEKFLRKVEKSIGDGTSSDLTMAKLADAIGKVIAANRDAQDAVSTDDKLSLAQKRLRLKAMQEKEEALYSRYLDIFLEQEKAKPAVREKAKALDAHMLAALL